MSLDPAKLAKLKKYDPAEYLETQEDVRCFLLDYFEECKPPEIADALKIITQSAAFPEIAKKAGLTEKTFAERLSDNGDPELSSLLILLEALDLKLCVVKA